MLDNGKSSQAGIFKLIKTQQERRRAASELRLNLFVKKGWCPGGDIDASQFSKELFIFLKTMATDTAWIISH